MRLVIACLLGLSGLLVAGCDRQKADVSQAAETAPAVVPAGTVDRAQAGATAPDIAFENGEGEPTRIADFAGAPVLVNLWATWCAPCIVEMPSLDALAARSGDTLHVVTLSQDIEGRAKVDQFFADQGYRTLEPYLDADLAFMTALAIPTLPTTILYDSEGREVWRKTGIADWNGDTAAGWIAEAG